VFEVIFLAKAHPQDLCMFILAFMSTLFLGVAEGVMICIAVSLLIIVKKGSIPYWSL
jgi:MFS superfamily sulfate permease-like transporter